MPYKLDTLAIHGGHEADAQYGSLTTPIHQTSTFIFDSAEQGAARFAGECEGYVYSRLGNPTVRELERRMAVLEGAEDAAATATGMAAVSAAILTNVKAGDHIIASRALYGCSFAFLSHMVKKFGISVTFVDMTDLTAVAGACRDNTTLMFFETPINPTLEVLDLQKLADFARQHNIISVCDNTFLTPLLQRPLTFGIDVVIHSATKYLNGHGDVVAGVICGRQDIITDIKLTALKDIGGTMSPHDAWLILRGLKTLPLRIQRHCESAQIVAEKLSVHPRVTSVYYPGLVCHPGHAMLGHQMVAAGGVLAFEIEGDVATAQYFLNQLKLCKIAVSLGDAESLIQHPATMTHSPYSQEEREQAGISDTLIRLSVGLEHVDDIIEDLHHALTKTYQHDVSVNTQSSTD